MEYMQMYFKDSGKENMMSNKLKLTLVLPNKKNFRRATELQRAFWLFQMRYMKGIINQTGKSLDLKNHGWFTPILFENRNLEKAKFLVISLNADLLDGLVYFELEKLRNLNSNEFMKSVAFGYKKVASYEEENKKTYPFVTNLNKEIQHKFKNT